MTSDLLTVRRFVQILQDEEMDSILAIESGGKVTLMSEFPWKVGDFYISASPRRQDDFFMERELTENQKRDMVRTLVICALACDD